MILSKKLLREKRIMAITAPKNVKIKLITALSIPFYPFIKSTVSSQYFFFLNGFSAYKTLVMCLNHGSQDSI